MRTLLLTLIAAVSLPAAAQSEQSELAFKKAIRSVVRMPANRKLQRDAWYKHRLNVLNVLWEDTGRYMGSSVGPNISDVTLKLFVKKPSGHTQRFLLPVLRHPNFTDKTADVRAEDLFVKVGNHNPGGQLAAVPLNEVLSNLREYVSFPEQLKGSGDLSAKRDTHYLVSAQQVFVPLPAEGKVEFAPTIFNYQSSPGNPAVLALVFTREGMSASVVEGENQTLFFNDAGKRALFTAERRSAVERAIKSETRDDPTALDQDSDVMMIVQVPLRYRQRRRSKSAPKTSAALGDAYGGEGGGGVPVVERAVLGHAKATGPFRELRGRRLVRDRRFPVRVTLQYYRATHDGVISSEDLETAANEIDRVYDDADFVGSLVVAHDERPTRWKTGKYLGKVAFAAQ